ncbi:MAG TPA: Ni/Fe hydrogenase subunit alpha [Terriglobia bacterium]|nr:Ni/Fe hydrogenase subunit alpha [Terriglobia bacterium]
MTVRLRNGAVTDVQLRIFEPPRLFEAFMRGRSYADAPDITARICGICPIAYQMSTVHALEAAMGVAVAEPIRRLRRLVYCGEWIESHVLHVFMLHAPDFLGYPNAIEMAKDYPGIVKKGLELRKLGNAIIELMAGRAIHPINVRVGGFYHIPSRRRLAALGEQLRRGRDVCREMVLWAGALPAREYTHDYEFVALRHPDEYPMNEGRIVSSRGLDTTAAEYDRCFEESQVPYSNALQSVVRGRGAYLTGPLARYNLNFDRLFPSVQEIAREAGLEPECRNPFRNIVVRMVEVLYAFEEAIRLIDAFEAPDAPSAAVVPHAGAGAACTEAPRGSLYHRYVVDESGVIVDARIVPPTSQNQKAIEDDLRHYVTPRADLPADVLRFECEQLIRNYDPCISCSTHFLKLNIERDA